MSRTSVLSDEEKRQRRNEASRRCYLKRKAAMEAAGQITPRGAKNKSRTNSVSVVKTSNVERQVEKLIKKFTKPVTSIKPMLREAATILNEVYKTCDEKMSNKLERQICSGLNVEIGIDQDAQKTYLSFTQRSKGIKTPSYKVEVSENAQVIEEITDNETVIEIDEDTGNPNEISVDPSLLEKADSEEFANTVMANNFDDNEIDDLYNDEDMDEDTDDDYMDEDEDEDDLDEDDEDDDEDDERPTKRRRRYSNKDYGSVRDYEEMGRWDMMGEMEAQGSFDY